MPPPPVAVPNVAGVPPVNFIAGFVLPFLLTQDLVSQFSAVFGPQWGIFDGGDPVITAESVSGFDFRADWTISDYPVEGGVFESYDKVLTPYLAKVRFASGSSVQARAELLAQVQAAAGTLIQYNVVTPEFTYLNANISHYDYKRQANQGVGLIVIDVWLQQVLVQSAGNLTTGQVQNPVSADPQNNGSIQPVPPETNTTLPPAQELGS